MKTRPMLLRGRLSQEIFLMIFFVVFSLLNNYTEHPSPSPGFIDFLQWEYEGRL